MFAIAIAVLVFVDPDLKFAQLHPFLSFLNKAAMKTYYLKEVQN